MSLASSVSVQEFSREKFKKTWKVLEQAQAEGAAPGFVAGLWDARDPDRFQILAQGSRRVTPSEQGISLDTVFDLASVTKVFGTAALAARLVERGWITWETPVSALLPQFSHGEIKIKHLLSHTAGFAAWAPFWEQIREKFSGQDLLRVAIADRQRMMRELVLASVPEVAVETRALYSDLSFLILGFALEEATGLPLDVAVKRWVWAPMGIEGAFYRRTFGTLETLQDVAATELSEWRGGVLQGQVHDENCWTMGGYGGHAGAFGRAEDVLRFARALCLGFFSPQTLRAMWTRVSRPSGCERTLGWDTPSSEGSSVGRLFSQASVGHLGFTGTSLWIEPEKGIAAVLLSNRVHPSRENIAIRTVRPLFHTALREDLGH